MKASVFIATSLDGFIAREDGGIDWLPSDESFDGEDHGYQEFIDSVDALVMGRNTYELVQSFGIEWPYGEKPVFVVTTRPLDIPENISDTVSVLSGPPGEIVRQLEGQGYQHLYVDGGVTIQGFLQEGLIQTLIMTRIPVLIGSGIPLFGAIPSDIHLRHLETHQYENGLVQSKYEVI